MNEAILARALQACATAYNYAAEAGETNDASDSMARELAACGLFVWLPTDSDGITRVFCQLGAAFIVDIHTLPASWASYLVNGDASGLDDVEQAAADRYLRNVAPAVPVDCGPDYFARSNDANDTGGDVCEFTFHSHLAPGRVVALGDM